MAAAWRSGSRAARSGYGQPDACLGWDALLLTPHTMSFVTLRIILLSYHFSIGLLSSPVAVPAVEHCPNDPYLCLPCAHQTQALVINYPHSARLDAKGELNNTSSLVGAITSRGRLLVTGSAGAGPPGLAVLPGLVGLTGAAVVWVKVRVFRLPGLVGHTGAAVAPGSHRGGCGARVTQGRLWRPPCSPASPPRGGAAAALLLGCVESNSEKSTPRRPLFLQHASGRVGRGHQDGSSSLEPVRKGRQAGPRRQSQHAPTQFKPSPTRLTHPRTSIHTHLRWITGLNWCCQRMSAGR